MKYGHCDNRIPPLNHPHSPKFEVTDLSSTHLGPWHTGIRVNPIAAIKDGTPQADKMLHLSKPSHCKNGHQIMFIQSFKGSFMIIALESKKDSLMQWMLIYIYIHIYIYININNNIWLGGLPPELQTTMPFSPWDTCQYARRQWVQWQRSKC